MVSKQMNQGGYSVKHEITKKVMSLLLSVAMVLTFFPAQAFAASAPTPQEIADVITPACADCGVAWLIDEYILKGR